MRGWTPISFRPLYIFALIYMLLTSLYWIAKLLSCYRDHMTVSFFRNKSPFLCKERSVLFLNMMEPEDHQKNNKMFGSTLIIYCKFRAFSLKTFRNIVSFISKICGMSKVQRIWIYGFLQCIWSVVSIKACCTTPRWNIASP